MEPEPHAAFTSLLVELFSAEELRRLLASVPDTRPLVAHLPGPAASTWEVAHQAVELLQRHGLLTSGLFATLLAHRPGQAAAIRAAATALGIVAPGADEAQGDVPFSPAKHSVLVRSEGHNRAGRFAYHPEQTAAELRDAVLLNWSLPSRELATGPVLLRYRYDLVWGEVPLDAAVCLGQLALPDGATLRLRTRVEPIVAAELAEGTLEGFSFWAQGG